MRHFSKCGGELYNFGDARQLLQRLHDSRLRQGGILRRPYRHLPTGWPRALRLSVHPRLIY